MQPNKIKDYGQLYIAFLVYSFVSVFAKIASIQENFFKTLFFMGTEIVLLGVYALIWQQVLKRFSLVVAMSNKGVTVIFSLVWSIIIFKESITLWNVVGAALIILGIWMVSADG